MQGYLLFFICVNHFNIYLLILYMYWENYSFGKDQMTSSLERLLETEPRKIKYSLFDYIRHYLCCISKSNIVKTEFMV